MTEEKWALEWSQKQNCSHIQKLGMSLAYAQKCMMDGRIPLYSIIMVGERDSCQAMANSQRPRLLAREEPITIADIMGATE